jgi:hypothetical protein
LDNLSAYLTPIASTTQVDSFVGQTNQIYVAFTLPIDLQVGDIITLSVPSTSQSYLDLFIGGSILVTLNTSDPLVGSNQTKSVTLTAQTSISAGITVRINSNLYITSLINSGTRSLSVQFSRNSFSYASGTFSVVVKTNSLIAASFTPTSSTVSATTSYNFSITTRNKLGSLAYVKVTLPTEILIKNSNSSCASISLSASPSSGSINPTPVCTILTPNIFTVTITNSTSSLTVSNILTLLVGGIINPISTKITDPILI